MDLVYLCIHLLKDTRLLHMVPGPCCVHLPCTFTPLRACLLTKQAPRACCKGSVALTSAVNSGHASNHDFILGHTLSPHQEPLLPLWPFYQGPSFHPSAPLALAWNRGNQLAAKVSQQTQCLGDPAGSSCFLPNSSLRVSGGQNPTEPAPTSKPLATPV